MSLAIAITGAWMGIPDDLRQSVPHGIVEVMTMAILALGLVGSCDFCFCCLLTAATCLKKTDDSVAIDFVEIAILCMLAKRTD